MKAASAVSLIVLLVMLGLPITGCNDLSEMADTAKKVAVQQAGKATREIAARTTKAAEDVKQLAGEQLDKAGQQIEYIVNETTGKIVAEIKAWIYQTLSPAFPWIFIILFLVVVGALKAAVPFSGIVVVQLPLVLFAYAMAFYLFSELGLVAFAIKGTLWLLMPVVLSCVVIYVFRKSLRQRLKAAKSGAIANTMGSPSAE